MPGWPARGIFLSYRRAEAAPYARLLQFQLRERFPDARVFMDMDSIEAGLDFAEVIQEALDSCAVLVALIGGQWATITDEEGHRRLDDPHDYVRFEVKTALARGVRVIPVLVDGAKPPQQQQLPPELRKLARLNALELSYGRYEYDADRLFDLIQRVLAAAPGAAVHDPGKAARQDLAPVRGSPVRAARLLNSAELVARSIPHDKSRVRALSDVAKALSARDPDRAARIFADAEGIAQSIDNEDDQGGALMAVARALAASDPAHAERVIRSVRGETKPEAMFVVAEALAATDPDRAERLAQSINEHDKTIALVHIAQALAATDPARAARLLTDAERVAQSITTEYLRPNDLAVVASALAATDPGRAARLFADAEHSAQSITQDGSWKAAALADIAKALAATDPGRAARLFADAERSAEATDEVNKDRALSEVASALAATDPDRAERIAQSITHKGERDSVLTNLASALAATDPDRAERIAQSITTYDVWKASVLTDVASALAATDPDRAERIAQSITNERWKAKALVTIAEA